MPVEVGIWKLGPALQPVQFTSIDTELSLENAICSDLSVIESDLLLIGRQVTTAYGKFIDVLACDEAGDLIIIELKRDRTPREVVAQLIDYATWVDGLTYSDVATIFKEKTTGAISKRPLQNGLQPRLLSD